MGRPRLRLRLETPDLRQRLSTVKTVNDVNSVKGLKTRFDTTSNPRMIAAHTSPGMPKPRPKSPISVPSEHAEQRALLTWASMSAGKHPELRLLFAIPNGGARSKAAAGKLKAEGVKPGVPDLCLPVARGGFHGLYLEMKRTQGGTLSPEQKQWHQDLIEQDYHVALCKGQPSAQHTLTTYLTLPKTQITKASQAHKAAHLLRLPTEPSTTKTPTPKPARLPNYSRKPILKWADKHSNQNSEI